MRVTRNRVKQNVHILFDDAMDVFVHHMSTTLHESDTQQLICSLRLASKRTHACTLYAFHVGHNSCMATRQLRRVLKNRFLLGSTTSRDDVLEDLITRLLNRGADPAVAVTGSNNSIRPLYYTAAYFGYINIIKRLFDMGIFYLQSDYDMCFKAAVSSGNLELARMLVSKGAHPHALDDTGRNCLSYALLNAEKNMSNDNLRVMMTYLLDDLGVDVNVQDSQGANALEIAIAAKHIDVVWMLLHRGANVNPMRPSKNYPLVLASYHSYSDVVLQLLELGTDPDVMSSKGFTALMVAQSLQIIVMLLERGADPNIKNDKTALHNAAHRGHLEAVVALLNHGAHIDEVSSTGYTALGYAVVGNYVDVVEVLLTSGADPNIRIADKHTLLHVAIQYNSVGIIGLLLTHGAVSSHTSAQFSDGWTGITPLITAVCCNSVEIVTMLLQHGVDVDCLSDDKKMSPLTCAIRTGNRQLIDLLLDYGAKVKPTNVVSLCPLQAAVTQQLPEIVELLIALGADVNSDDSYALMIASYVGNIDIARILLDHGARITRPCNGTPLLTALRAGHNDIVALLLERGADVNERQSGSSVLAYAIQHASLENIEMLLDYGADVNDKTVAKDQTMLMMAIHNKREEIAELFVHRGADVNCRIPGVVYHTALTYAIRHDNERLVRFLVSHGADPNIVNDAGYTALILASEHMHTSSMKALLECGADPDIQIHIHGHTALIRAIDRKHGASVKVLLEHGADPNIRLYLHKHTALMVAIQYDLKEIADMLIKKTDLTLRASPDGTALLYAIQLDRPGMVELLLQHGNDPNDRYISKKKHTALMRAVTFKNRHITEILVRYGADPNIQCENEGDTALMLAASLGNRECVEILLGITDVSLCNCRGQTVLDCARPNLVDLFSQMI